MREPDLGEALEAAFNYQIGSVHTAIPGIIVSIRDGLVTSYVDVQPTVNMISEDDDPLPRSVALNIPLVFPVSSSGGITFPVKVGDTVLLIYSMRGLDTWKRGDGTTVTPTDFRKLDSRDAIAIPGLPTINQGYNNPAKRSNSHSTDDTSIFVGLGTPNETEVRLRPSGDLIINAPNSVTVNSLAAVVNSPDITLNGNTRITGTLIVEKLFTFLQGITGNRGTGSNTIQGDFNFAGGSLTHEGKNIGATHQHTNVQNGSGISGPPQ